MLSFLYAFWSFFGIFWQWWQTITLKPLLNSSHQNGSAPFHNGHLTSVCVFPPAGRAISMFYAVREAAGYLGPQTENDISQNNFEHKTLLLHNCVFSLIPHSDNFSSIWRVVLWVCPSSRLHWQGWSSLWINQAAPLSFVQKFNLHILWSDTSFWNVLFCQTLWWLSESICQEQPGWSDNKLHANSPCLKKISFSLTRHADPYLES